MLALPNLLKAPTKPILLGEIDASYAVGQGAAPYGQSLSSQF